MALDTLLQVDWDFKTVKTTYLTHGLHPYPAKYIPQIPHSLISELSKYGDTVADIFCGSGTTLVEANLLGRNAIGIDANPLACLISEAKTTRFEPNDESALGKLVERAQGLSSELLLREMLSEKKPYKSSAYRPDNDALLFWFEPFVIEELAEILSWCRDLSTKTSQQIALTALSSIIVTVSKQDSDTRYVRREKGIRPGYTFLKFANALSKSISAVSEFTKQVDNKTFCKVYHSDILATPDVGSFDLMVCSPPYPNAYSYHLYHKTRMIWLGMDYKEFKQQEIGSHRKYSKVGASIETFKQEMQAIFDWLYQHLKNERYACFIIGDSTIKGEKIDNAELLSSIAIKSGFIEHARLSRELQATKKAFNPAIGKIRDERILILQKRG
jgi:site-specific DNA-methyltransferase (cytosine-N4-specific)